MFKAFIRFISLKVQYFCTMTNFSPIFNDEFENLQLNGSRHVSEDIVCKFKPFICFICWLYVHKSIAELLGKKIEFFSQNFKCSYSFNSKLYTNSRLKYDIDRI